MHESERLTMGFTTFTTERTEFTENAQRRFDRFANPSFNYNAMNISRRDAET